MNVLQLSVALLALLVATTVVLGDAAPVDDEGEGDDVSSKVDRRRDVGEEDDVKDEDDEEGNSPSVKCATEACTKKKILKELIAGKHPVALNKGWFRTLGTVAHHAHHAYHALRSHHSQHKD